MALQVLVTFPGTMSLGDFEDRMGAISEMGCTIQLGTDITRPIGEFKVSKAKAGRDFNRVMSSEGAVTETLTAAEEALLDKGLKLTHDTGSSPLLDAMTRAAAGTLKPNMSREIRAYFTENPGHNSARAASNLADKFVAHYKDLNTAFLKIRGLINVLSAPSNSSRCLENRGGWGDLGQFHVLT